MNMTPGVTPSGEGISALKWNILGQTYIPKLVSDNAFVWHALLPADSFVPPHVHPTQDEWITILDGELEVAFGEEVFTARAGDTVKMPMGIAHGITNKSGKDANCFFLVLRQVASFLTCLMRFTIWGILTRLFGFLHCTRWISSPRQRDSQNYLTPNLRAEALPASAPFSVSQAID